MSSKPHRSDCAVHNEPAMPNGPCDCGVDVPPPDPLCPECTATVGHDDDCPSHIRSAVERAEKAESQRDALLSELSDLEYRIIPRDLADGKPRCPRCWCSPKDAGGDGHDAECALAMALAPVARAAPEMYALLERVAQYIDEPEIPIRAQIELIHAARLLLAKVGES